MSNDIYDLLNIISQAIYGKDVRQAIVDAIRQCYEGSTDGLTADVKQALMNCFNYVAWKNDDPNASVYINALHDAMYPPANLESITAVYTQSGTVYDTDSLDTLKSDLVVTAHYTDLPDSAVSDYALTGTLEVGTSTIIVSYRGKTATFDVTVSEYEAPDTTAEILTEDVVWSKTAPDTKSATGFGITKFYAYEFTQAILESSQYWDSTNGYMTTTGWAGVKVYTPDTNTYEAGYSWPSSANYKNVLGNNGTYTNQFSITRNEVNTCLFIRQNLAAVNANGISFSIPLADIDDCYAYWAEQNGNRIYPLGVSAGDIIFAGKNTPYYGLNNISEAEGE